MGGIARIGDIVGKGGVLTAPFSPDVTVNNRNVALTGCVFTAHPPCNPNLPQHCFGVVVGVPNGVTVNGMIPLTSGSIASCGDKVLIASSDVIIAGGLVDMAVSLAAGQVSPSSLSALETLAIQSAGKVVNGEDISKVAQGAAVQYGVGTAAGAVSSEVKKVIK